MPFIAVFGLIFQKNYFIVTFSKGKNGFYRHLSKLYNNYTLQKLAWIPISWQIELSTIQNKFIEDFRNLRKMLEIEFHRLRKASFLHCKLSDFIISKVPTENDLWSFKAVENGREKLWNSYKQFSTLKFLVLLWPF